MKHKKTNAMRMLDRAKIDYEVKTFDTKIGIWMVNALQN